MSKKESDELIGSNSNADPVDYTEILPDDTESIQNIQKDATKLGLDLLKLLNTKSTWDSSGDSSKNRYLQLASSESLTCGLIMSTLVDIPWGGYLKYGCFGVYDTDAKRVFNGVTTEDVYTHECAEQMAVGILNNSNATLAIAVSGNAMPYGADKLKLGEVFIGIAGYKTDGTIQVISKVINACNSDNYSTMQKYCKDWVHVLELKADDGETNKYKFNTRTKTATICKLIRYYTVIAAYQMCIDFINKFDPAPIDYVFERRIKPPDMINIPANKYPGSKSYIKLNDQPECSENPMLCDNDVRNLVKNTSEVENAVGGKTRKYKKHKLSHLRTKRRRIQLRK